MVKDLDITLYATIRSGIEPLSQIQGLRQNQTVAGKGSPDVELTARYQTDADGKLVADVTVSCDSTVQPVGVGDEVPGMKGTVNIGFGNHTVYGVMVADRNGKRFGLGLKSGANQIDKNSKRTTMRMSLELVPDRDCLEPSTITFWGTHPQHIDIPVTLHHVPLSK